MNSQVFKNLKKKVKTTTQQSGMRIFGLTLVLLILIIFPTVSLAFAAEEVGEYLDRRVEIWNLFFRMMVVAFAIGAVVSGTLIWLCFRFRESNPKAKPTEYEGTGELDRL